MIFDRWFVNDQEAGSVFNITLVYILLFTLNISEAAWVIICKVGVYLWTNQSKDLMAIFLRKFIKYVLPRLSPNISKTILTHTVCMQVTA